MRELNKKVLKRTESLVREIDLVLSQRTVSDRVESVLRSAAPSLSNVRREVVDEPAPGEAPIFVTDVYMDLGCTCEVFVDGYGFSFPECSVYIPDRDEPIWWTVNGAPYMPMWECGGVPHSAPLGCGSPGCQCEGLFPSGEEAMAQ